MQVDGKQYHIGCTASDIGGWCILPGDPGRCKYIAGFFDSAEYIGRNREFEIWTGMVGDKRVSAVSTGIGGPSAVIAMEELVELGAHTFIRVGTCGGINLKVKPGDAVIASASVRQEGTSREYAPIEFPAAADFEVTLALKQAADRLGIPNHVGVVQCKDSFYGQHDPKRMPVSYELLNKWEAWKRIGVLASEMESSALFVCAAALGVRCGTVLHTVWNQERDTAGYTEDSREDVGGAIKICIEAIREMEEYNK